MIRKKTVIKPNLRQAATESRNPVQSLAPAPPNNPPTQVDSTPPSEPQVEPRGVNEEELSKKVNDAISHLTGQRFEPIRSTSLRNSANKDVKLKDLLFINPPLTKDQRRHRKDVSVKKNPKPSPESNQSQSSCDEPSLVPKVRLGPGGKLILDESSTVINRKSAVKDQDAIIEDNEEIISRTNYESYRRKSAAMGQTKWSAEDTEKFYHALTLLGTDFSMMESLLFDGHRSRTELHKKFKREERLHKTKIDIALSRRISVTSEELDGLRGMFGFARASNETA